MSDETHPETRQADRLRALAALRRFVDEPWVFEARLDHPRREFYWITIKVGAADITTLVSNATEYPLIKGRFSESIKNIIDKLATLGVNVTDFKIVEVE